MQYVRMSLGTLKTQIIIADMYTVVGMLTRASGLNINTTPVLRADHQVLG